MPSSSDARTVGRLLIHEIRIDVLVRLGELGVLTPLELSELLDRPLGVVAYHVRVLHDDGLVRLTKKVPVRGAISHRYGLTPRGARALAVVEKVDRIMQGVSDR